MASDSKNAEASLVTRDDRGVVCVLTLNRSNKRNALSRALIDALADALSAIRLAPGIRAVVLAANGQAFCSGMDLNEAAALAALPETERDVRAVADLQAYGDVLDALHTFPRPVIAAVNGDALAGGAGLALACDMVVMGSDAHLGYPEVRRGIVASVVMHDLVRLTSDRRARQLLLSGLPIDAATALAWGLVNDVVAPADCLERAVTLAERFAECAPQALATTKSLLDEATGRPHSLRAAAAVSAALRGSDEAAEGIRAFGEKRALSWHIDEARVPSYQRSDES